MNDDADNAVDGERTDAGPLARANAVLPGLIHLLPVAARPYGVPFRYEANLQCRQSSGLTRVDAVSVSFAPLQGFFGIVTPNGLHFERHHQGWHDIDPTRHRLMVNGLCGARVTRWTI
jgi:hypothetical protein